MMNDPSITALAPSTCERMRIIERDRLIRDRGWHLCERCNGAGDLEEADAFGDPTCGHCGGVGAVE